MRAVIAALLALLAPLPAAAQARPPSPCRVEIEGLDFGTYSGLDPSPNTALGRLTVRCTPAPGSARVPLVTLNPGYSGNYLDRFMTSGGHRLHYNIYADPAHRFVLGDGSAGTVGFPPPRTRALGQASWPLFGVILPRQRVPAGEYGDTLLIQVEF